MLELSPDGTFDTATSKPPLAPPAIVSKEPAVAQVTEPAASEDIDTTADKDAEKKDDEDNTPPRK